MLKNLPPSTSLANEIVANVEHFLVEEGLLARESSESKQIISTSGAHSLRRLRSDKVNILFYILLDIQIN